MTYQEMQERLTKVETLIQAVQQPRYQNKVQNVQETLTQLNTIKENLENKMKIIAESEENMFVTTKTGGTKSVAMSTKQAMDLKRDPNVTGIETTKGKDLKEGENEFNEGDKVKIADSYGGGTGKVKEVHGSFVVLTNGKSYHESDLTLIQKANNESIQKPKTEALRRLLKKQVHKILDELYEGEEDDGEYINEAPHGYYYIRVRSGKHYLLLENILLKLSIKFETDDIPGEVTFYFKEHYWESKENKAKKLIKKSKITILDSNIPGYQSLFKTDYEERRSDENTSLREYIEHRGVDEFLSLALYKDFDNHVDSQEATSGDTRPQAVKTLLEFLELNFKKDDHDINEEEGEDYDPDQAQREDEDDHPVPYHDKGDQIGEDLDSGHQDDGDLDLGHQDDEPHMLKKEVYDIAVYAAKLYKQLKKYDAMDGEVDFPHWWQRKVTLAREYMSKAQHYLEFEEKEPMIDQLALEGKMKNEEKVLTYNDFIQMVRDDMMAGASPDETPNEEKIKKIAKSRYNQYLNGVSVDKLFEAEKGDLNEELKGDWREGLDILQDILNDLADKGEEIRQTVVAYFPEENGWCESYGCYKPGTSGDRDLAELIDTIKRRAQEEGHNVYEGASGTKHSIKDIQKAHSTVVAILKDVVAKYKTAEGQEKEDLLDELKSLNASKKKLEEELEKAVAGTGVGQELDTNISEAVESLPKVDLYTKLAGYLQSLNSEYNAVAYAPSNGTVKFGNYDYKNKKSLLGVGHRRNDAELGQKFDQEPGNSAEVWDTFYHAHREQPEQTKEAIERITKKSFIVDITDLPLIKYVRNIKNKSNITEKQYNLNKIQETKISKKRFKELLAEAYYEVIAEQEAEVNTDDSLTAFFKKYGSSDPDINNPDKPVNPIIRLHGSKEVAEKELEREVTTNAGAGGESFTFKLKGGQEYDLYKKDGEKGMWTVEIRGNKHILDANGIEQAKQDIRILSKEAPTPTTDEPAELEDDGLGGADALGGGGGGGADLGGGTDTGGGEPDLDTEPDTTEPIATADDELDFEPETEV